ncbi:MAG: 50S ribosomal protein L9 [Planctomycetes bacterium]|nr:50S ribosomal protein L9 [Planctomycetota bacterium]
MARVELMLRENVRYLGKVGDVVTVAAGYARNYLIPNRLAVKATSENQRVLARKRERLDAEEAARNAELAARVAVLEGVVLETTERSDENGHLYGSVNASRVAELLNERDFEISDDNIRMARAIKESGTHEVELHLFGETSVTVTIEVTGDGENRDAAMAEIIAEVDAQDEEAGETEEEAPAEESAEESEEA